MTHLNRENLPPIELPQYVSDPPWLVVGAVPLTTKVGERCHQWVAMLHGADRPPGEDYAVADLLCGGPGRCGERWLMDTSTYDLSAEDARSRMLEKANRRTVR